MPDDHSDTLEITVNGQAVTVGDRSLTLLDVLRFQALVLSVKDGCSPQGQCGCCTVLVDGRPRVSCVTPVRRLRGKAIITVEGFDPNVAGAWADAFAATGGSQCGFCTPGIICRFEGLRATGADHHDREAAAKALLAHLCRCTGWQPVIDAWERFGSGLVDPKPDSDAKPNSGVEVSARVEVGVKVAVRNASLANETAARASELRAELEGGVTQQVGPHVALGQGGFADDTAPTDALFAAASGDGWVVAPTRAEALRLAAGNQARHTTAVFGPPIALPAGEWALSLQTSWVEPGYLETDASWCEPGGRPASPLANGGAFGAKRASRVTDAARMLADRYQQPVRVLYSRIDAVRRGPKRPPLAAGLRADGSGVVRVARTPGIRQVIGAVAPGVHVVEVEIAGPPTAVDIRGAGWLEMEAMAAALRGEVGWITAPGGGAASASISADGSVDVWVRCGDPLDETVLRSYCTGAAHMGLGLVTSESLGVDENGEIHDLTLRSFGILRAVDTPTIRVTIEPDDGPTVNGSEAVFAAVASAAWLARGCPAEWPAR